MSALKEGSRSGNVDPGPAAVLRRLSLFAALGEEELARLAPAVRRRLVPRGHVIFREGEPVTAIHFLTAGCVKITALTADGREQTLTILQPGDFFPHLGFLGGGSYPATAVALEESTVVTVERGTLLDLLRQNGDLALDMLLAMARRLDDLQQRVRELAERDLRVRVARALLHLLNRHGRPDRGGARLDLRLTHQELASLTGTARESVSRTLAALRREGLLEMDGGTLLVPNREALRTVADGLR